VGRRTPQCLRREKSAKPTTHNDDAWTLLTLHCRVSLHRDDREGKIILNFKQLPRTGSGKLTLGRFP
jgi:hypothetical protein